MPAGEREEVQRFMQAATADAERLLHLVRLGVLLLIFVRLAIVAGDDMLAGAFKPWLRASFLAAAALASFGLRASPRLASEARLIASTVLDVSLAVAILMPSVVWPRDTWEGLLRAPDVMMFPVVAASGGLRMTLPTAATGAAASLLGLGGLLALDLAANPTMVTYGWQEVLLALAVMAGAGILSLGTVRFAEGLLLQTAARTADVSRVRQQFGSYMAPEFARLVLDAPGPLETRRTHAVILFSDLRGFTTYSEGLAPDRLVDELNDYLAAVVAPIHEHGGVVDKYVGDAVMAVFGVPTGTGSDHLRAIRAAAGMRQALDAHNQARAARGLPPLRQGIGVHAGDVVAGPVGTAERLQFTVLGDAVNVAARLEGETKSVGCDVLLSAAVVDAARTEGELPELESGPSLTLRGRDRPVDTWILR